MNECRAALNVRGRGYLCDNFDAGHTTHTNAVAQAIWSCISTPGDTATMRQDAIGRPLRAVRNNEEE